jgi:hypothetical protein
MEISLLGVDEIIPGSGWQSKTRVKLISLKIDMKEVIVHE